MNAIVIDVENPIHQQISKFFGNTQENYVLSDSIGKILCSLGFINEDMTIEEVNKDVLVRGFIREKIGLSFSAIAITSIFGKEYNVADQHLFLYCSGNPNFNNYISTNMPNIPSIQKENLRKQRDKLFKYVNSSILSLISGFPLSDRVDPREINDGQQSNKKRKGVQPIIQPILHAPVPNMHAIEAELAKQDVPIDEAQEEMQDDALNDTDSDEEAPVQELAIINNQGEQIVEADGYTASFKSSLLHNLPSIVDGVYITLDIDTNILTIQYVNDN
jgi:hypothetical protein